MSERLRLSSPAPTIVGLIVALGWPMLFLALPGQTHQDVGNGSQDVQIILMEWAAVIAVALIVIFWERLPFFASVGFRRPGWRDALAVVIMLCLMAIAIVAAAFVFHARGAVFSTADPRKILQLPLVLRVSIVLTAGICEEILFRGYAIERVTALTGKVWIGAVAAIVLFTLGHVPRYGFSVGLFGVAVIALLLTLLYVRRRNLWPCIAAHCVIDGLPLIVAPAFVHAHLMTG